MEILGFEFKRKPSGPATRLYEPSEVGGEQVIAQLETTLTRLERFEPLLENRALLQEFVAEILAQPYADFTDPLVKDESAQFYRGAFWLDKKIKEKLANLETQIDQTSDRLLKERRAAETVAK